MPPLSVMAVSSHRLSLPDGREVAVDDTGYLLDARDWTRELADYMAGQDGIELSADHWAVLEILRSHFERFDVEPPMRVLVRLARQRWGEERGTSRYLYRLFPDGPVKQACRYAGLPRPLSCT